MGTSLDAEALRSLRVRVEREVDERGLPSCQYALALGGEIIADATIGEAPTDARYMIFSCSKVLASAVVWRLMGRGLLDPDLPVSTWWPGFAANGKDAITLAHVMTHTAGVPNAVVDAITVDERERRVSEIEAWVPEWQPGTQFEYHPMSAHWILAELVERVVGVDHLTALRELLLDPLGLERLELGVPIGRQGDVQPLTATMAPFTRDELEAEVGATAATAIMEYFAAASTRPAPDAVGLVSTPQGLAAGVPGAGAVSDASTLALLYQELIHDTRHLWDPAVLADATSRIRNDLRSTLGVPAMRGLGIEIGGGGPTRERRWRIGSGFTSPGTFGHSGAGGQIAWADPRTGLSFVFLTNGMDRNYLRTVHRDRALNELAASCVPAP